MKIKTILFTSLIALAAVAMWAESASAGDYEIRDRDGRVAHTVREPSGPVLNRWEVRGREGKVTHTIREPSGPVMDHYSVRDRSGREIGRIRKR
ncbi:MAG: hypothetical protein GEU87_02435 [Alphaproteobacteria bacterium]|nr:hypothetical protein [Alphaproteobacteria bacterium]